MNNVFVIGATNRPDLLEPALLRPGRFDRKIYINVCDDPASKNLVLQAQTRLFNMSEDVDLDSISTQLPRRMSGADIGAVCRTAYSLALERVLTSLSSRALEDSAGVNSASVDYDDENTCSTISNYLDSLPDIDLKVWIHQRDFLQAVGSAKSSITEAELEDYVSLGSAFDSTKCLSDRPVVLHSSEKSVSLQQEQVFM